MADVRCDLRGDWPLSGGSCEAVIATHVLEHLPDAGHFFDEAERVLAPGGRLEVTVPLGTDAAMDDGHVREWTWRSPEQWCLEASRPWDEPRAFVLSRRRVCGGLLGPERLLQPLVRRVAPSSPRWFAHRCGYGELTAVYARAGR